MTKTILISNGELSHHGILGQKWGVRRYQNKDGTLTAAGKRRLDGKVSYDEQGRLSSERDKNNAKGYIHANVAADYKNLNTGLKAGSDMAGKAGNIAAKSAERDRSKARREMDLSNMSDQELQAAVNRLNMERNYKALSTESIASGKDYASSILSTAGDVIAIGASVASIAMAIHTIRS